MPGNILENAQSPTQCSPLTRRIYIETDCKERQLNSAWEIGEGRVYLRVWPLLVDDLF